MSADVPHAIPAQTTITSTLVIGAGPTIGSVEVVDITIAHTYPGDIRTYLISPQGTSVELFRSVCGGQDWTPNNTGFTLDDNAPTQFGATCPPLWGFYRPSGRLGSLAGERSTGTWSLRIEDVGTGDSGTLDGWGLRISSPSCPPIPVCPVVFSDVPPTQPFYPYIQCLACRGIVSGYADGTFRPGNDVTRGQLSKVLAGAAGLSDPIPTSQQTFADVPNANPFWLPIERLYAHAAISGYTCGGPGEPCDAQHRPYFRPAANATRGQIAKIAATVAVLLDPVPDSQQTFADVPHANPFWLFIERLSAHGVISGYTCGGPGEPCDALHRPYFRWGANTTRGQIAKITTNTFNPGCATLGRPVVRGLP